MHPMGHDTQQQFLNPGAIHRFSSLGNIIACGVWANDFNRTLPVWYGKPWGGAQRIKQRSNLGASYTYFHKYLPKTENFHLFVSCLRGSHDILTKNNFLYIYKTHLRNVLKTHNFDDYFIFKCLLLGVNPLFEKMEIIEIPLAAVSKTLKKHKKQKNLKFWKKYCFLWKYEPNVKIKNWTLRFLFFSNIQNPN